MKIGLAGTTLMPIMSDDTPRVNNLHKYQHRRNLVIKKDVLVVSNMQSTSTHEEIARAFEMGFLDETLIQVKLGEAPRVIHLH